MLEMLHMACHDVYSLCIPQQCGKHDHSPLFSHYMSLLLLCLIPQYHAETSLIVKKCVLNLVNCFSAPIYYALFARDAKHCQVLVYLLLAVHLVRVAFVDVVTRCCSCREENCSEHDLESAKLSLPRCLDFLSFHCRLRRWRCCGQAYLLQTPAALSRPVDCRHLPSR